MDVVLIPAYNNGSAICGVVRASARHADAVVVCDDGSSDDTAARAEGCGAVVLRHGRNRGKGAALRTLFDKAVSLGADRACTIDGDGQFDPSEIRRLNRAQESSRADIVVGYRFDGQTDMPRYRELGNKILDGMTNAAAGSGVRDTQSGFRVYSRKAMASISFRSDGFAADSEILIDAARRGLSVVEQKVTVRYGGAAGGGGQIHSQNPLSHGYGVFGTLLAHVAIRHPLRLLGIPGMALLVLGAGYSVVVISIFNDIGYFSVPSTLVALGSLTCGLILLLMSVVLYAIRISGRA